MNANKLKALQDAEDAFSKTKTTHGSVREKEALAAWRNLCETEEEEQVAISAYLRRETNRERRAKEKLAPKEQTSKEIKHERKREAQTPPKTEKRRGKKSVRPRWWENY